MTINTNHMKYFIAPLIIALSLMACGDKTTGNQTLDTLIAKRDSLKLVQDSIGKEIARLEEQIAALDTGIKAPVVELATISKGSFNSYFQTQGIISTDNQANLWPSAGGTIKKIYVREGDRVSVGQKLAQLDDAVVRQTLSQLEVNLDLANENYNRLKKLWDQKIGSEMQVLQAKTQKESIEEQMKQVREQLALYTITSPIAGTVDKIYSKEGEFAAAGTPSPVMIVVNLTGMYMTADVSENYLSVVKNGQAVQVLLPNMDTLRTTVSRIGNIINPNNRTFEVTLQLPNNPELKPNLVGNVRFVEYHADDVVVLPTSLIMRDAEDRPFVFIEENMTAKKIIVQTGRSADGQTEILGGLTGTEKIVSKGARKLSDGQAIRLK
jgi:membrane fusion protein, multidrug efflux system